MIVTADADASLTFCDGTRSTSADPLAIDVSQFTVVKSDLVADLLICHGRKEPPNVICRFELEGASLMSLKKAAKNRLNDVFRIDARAKITGQFAASLRQQAVGKFGDRS